MLYKGIIGMSKVEFISFEAEATDIKDKVTEYWSERADSFFEQRKRELESIKATKWLAEIKEKIKESGLSEKERIRILDVGCGSGFFPVLLGREGYEVIGIDLTEEMIVSAKKMIDFYGLDERKVSVMQMDAEKPEFDDDTFDVVISRNLTWTLPHPVESYMGWKRVLKKGGLLLNFDAEYAKGAHKYDDSLNRAHKYVSTDLKEKCHEIYHMLTISALDRPDWDLEVLKEIGFINVEADTCFADRIFDIDDEFYIPDRMFMISAVK